VETRLNSDCIICSRGVILLFNEEVVGNDERGELVSRSRRLVGGGSGVSVLVFDRPVNFGCWIGCSLLSSSNDGDASESRLNDDVFLRNESSSAVVNRDGGGGSSSSSSIRLLGLVSRPSSCCCCWFSLTRTCR